MIEEVEEPKVDHFGDVTVRARELHRGLREAIVINDLTWLLNSRWNLVNEVSIII